jgi:DHA1 family multidrug resistance protein-like MFS transporter
MTRTRTGVGAILADRSVVAIVGISFVLMLGNGMVLPVLPLFARSFGVGYGAAGLLIAAYGIVRIGFDLVAGAIVDHTGERGAGAAGLGLVGVFALLTGLAPSFALAVVWWGAVGASSALAQTASYAYLLRVVPRNRMARTMGIFYGSFNIGLAAGGFIGGFLADHLGLETPLYGAAVLATLAGVLYLRYVPRRVAQAGAEAERATSPARLRSRLSELLRTPGIAAALMGQLAYLWVFSAVFGTLLALFGRDELGMSPSAIGIVFAIGLGVELVLLYPAGSVADRYGRKLLLVPALVGTALTAALIGFAGGPVTLGLLVAVLAVVSGVGGVAPSAMLSDVAPRGATGTAAGVFRLSGDVGFALGPLVAGLVASGVGLQEAFAVSALPALVALVFVLRAPETLHRREGEALDAISAEVGR